MSALRVALALFAIATLQAQAETKTVTFLCDKGIIIPVAFADDSAALTYGGQQVMLAQQPVASGYLYSNGIHSLRGKGDEAVWSDAVGAERQCRNQEQAVKQPQIDPPLPALAGTGWRLVHFQSSDNAIGTVIPPRVERYWMEFLADGTLALKLDCNRAAASWEFESTSGQGGALSVSAGRMTRAACGEGALDSQIAGHLQWIRSYTFDDAGRLALALDADGGIYLWEPAPAE